MIAVTIIILIGTLMPSDGISKINLWDYDKVGHFLMFMVWTYLFGLVRAIRMKSPPKLWTIFILGLFYGLLIEILQFILPTNRQPEILDFIADALGSWLAIYLLSITYKKIFGPKKI